MSLDWQTPPAAHSTPIQAAPPVRDTCRAPFNHDWRETGSDMTAGGLFTLRMRCAKCGTSFSQIINHTGAIFSGRRYKYQSDYKDPNHWSRSDWRRNFLLKLTARQR